MSLHNLRLLSFVLLAVLTLAGTAFSQQSLDLHEAYRLAEETHPLGLTRESLDKAGDSAQRAARARLLPQVQLTGQATYQNEVTSFSIPLPDVDLPTVPLEQFRVVAEINQLIYDGGAVKNQAALQRTSYNTRVIQTEVDLYHLKGQVRDVFFAVLMAEESISITNSLLRTIEIRLNQVESMLKNGVGLPNNADVLRAEQIRVRQNLTELESARKSAVIVLSVLIGNALNPDVQLVRPTSATTEANESLIRPEIRLFQERNTLAGLQERLIAGKRQPKVGLFAQGGVGRPGLNFLKDKIRPIAMGGIRLQWTLWDSGSIRHERQMARFEKDAIDSQERAFQQGMRVEAVRMLIEIEKYEKLLAQDDELISLRTRIRETVGSQFESGVATSSQLLEEINAENQARLARSMHELLWLKSRAMYQHHLGE